MGTAKGGMQSPSLEKQSTEVSLIYASTSPPGSPLPEETGSQRSFNSDLSAWLDLRSLNWKHPQHFRVELTLSCASVLPSSQTGSYHFKF